MNPNGPLDAGLRLRDIRKKFGDLTALDGVSLEIGRGEVFGLLGPNGAGKTTLIRIIVGLLAQDGGEVEVVGLSGAPRSQAIGICPQELVIWDSLTCLEQLEFVATLYGATKQDARARATSLLGRLGLDEKSHTLARRLSGGMKRRLNLALAIVHEPKVVLLDEPEAGLDPHSRVLIRELIRSLAGHMTIILTSHNMDEVERTADRVGIIDHGRLLVTDTPEALIASVGKGDLLCVELEKEIEDSGAVCTALGELRAGLQVLLVDGTLHIHGLHVVDVIADVVGLLRSRRIPMRSLSLRENTLEDVFISLTGRKLS